MRAPFTKNLNLTMIATLCAAWIAACPQSAAAEGAGESNLTLAAAVDLALNENLQLKGLRARWEAMTERPAQASALPNPMFSFGAMDMEPGGNWPDTNEKRYMLEQALPGFGKRGLKAGVARQDAEIMRQDFEAMVRDVVMMVKETYYDLQAVELAAAITRDDEQVLKRMAAVAEAMYTAGERSQQDVIKAQTEITMLKQKLLEYEAQANTLKARLNTLLNRHPESSLSLARAEPAAGTERDSSQLDKAAQQARPEIQGAEAALRRNMAERDLMKKEYWPDYRFGVEYRDFADEENMVMVTIGIDLPVWRTKNRAAVRESEKMVESGNASLLAARQQVSFDVQDARYKLLVARRTLDLYKTELIPQAEARFSASEAGYRSSKADFMDLLESQRFLLNARVMAAMAEGSVGMQQARLDRAMGLKD